jgi:predicted TIM-barrel fold metal-dependent hydrolase
VQFLLDIEDHPDIDTFLGSFATEVVIDHMGRPDPNKGVNAPGFQALIRLLKSGRGWAKLSAPYRTSLREPPYDDITPFAHALVAVAPDRLVWGSDWPHVLLETTMPDDGDLVDQIAVWVPDEAVRKRILVDNAETLYGFGRAQSVLSRRGHARAGALAVNFQEVVHSALAGNADVARPQ